MSYGDEVSHVFNLSQFNNTKDLVAEASKIPQKTGTKTNTFLAIETARYCFCEAVLQVHIFLWNMYT